jgi:hypothetical protein
MRGNEEEFGVRIGSGDRSERGPGLVTAGHSSEDEAKVMAALARLAVGHDELAIAAGRALARMYLTDDEGT